MTEEAIKQRIETGRRFMARWSQPGDETFESDQQKKLPQPPLVKAPMRETAIELPKNFEDLELNNDILRISAAEAMRPSVRYRAEVPATNLNATC